MEGFLGTSASFSSDLTLILTWVFGIVVIIGAINARRRRFSGHCPLMATGALLNWLPVLVVMTPMWLSVVGGEPGIPTGGVKLTPVAHGALGAVTQLLMTYTVTRMYWLENLPPHEPIWLMRITLVMWLLTLIGGTFVYVALYVL